MEVSQNKSDIFIGIGGGKTIDTSKAVANAIDIPLIVIPTAASTDAPTSAFSVVYLKNGNYDQVIYHKKNPEIVLVDTEIIIKAPIRLFIAGMGDALSTYFEARANAESDTANYVGNGYRRCKISLVISKACFDLLMEDGLKAKIAAEGGICTEAFENIVETNILFSGLGFENTGCALAHSINNALTILPETVKSYHGEKVAFGTICQLVMENRCMYEIKKVIKFCIEVGLPITLKDLGINDISSERINNVAEKVAEENSICHAEPFKVSTKMVFDAIYGANALGNYFKTQSFNLRYDYAL